jgi:hypothetical protein
MNDATGREHDGRVSVRADCWDSYAAESDRRVVESDACNRVGVRSETGIRARRYQQQLPLRPGHERLAERAGYDAVRKAECDQQWRIRIELLPGGNDCQSQNQRERDCGRFSSSVRFHASKPVAQFGDTSVAIVQQHMNVLIHTYKMN